MTLEEAIPIAMEYQKHSCGHTPYDRGQPLPYTDLQISEALNLVIEHSKATGNFIA